MFLAGELSTKPAVSDIAKARHSVDRVASLTTSTNKYALDDAYWVVELAAKLLLSLKTSGRKHRLSP